MSMRKACLPLILLSVPAALPAQVSDSAVSRFNECAVITDNSQRLACFDRVTRDVRAANQAPTPTTRPGTPQQQARNQRETFGLNPEQMRQGRTKPAELGRLEARVAATREFIPGYWVLMLDDGAIWQVTEARKNFQPPRRGEKIRIRRGALGGYLLYVGSQTSIRVNRVS